jgi:lysozyme family protein
MARPGPPADEEVRVAVHRGRAQAAALLQRVTAVGHGVDRDGGGVGGMGLMAQEESDHRVGATC